MPMVKVKSDDYFEKALRQFKRICEKAGVITTARNQRFHEKAAETRKLAKAAAVKRSRKARVQQALVGKGKKPKVTKSSDRRFKG